MADPSVVDDPESLLAAFERELVATVALVDAAPVHP